MSRIYEDNYLIESAVDAIWTAHGDRCTDECDCGEVAKELGKRFLNV
jgi:hypothetical protein